MSKSVTARAIVSGRVQGVSFRQSTCDFARSLGVRGYVRNLPDGRVEAVFVGANAIVQQALDYVRIGPRAARVETVEVTVESSIEEFGENFEIR